MGKVKVAGFSISLDGFGAGFEQNLENPIGLRGQELHSWIYNTRSFHKMTGKDNGTEGIDNSLLENSFENVGVWIMGRNMFGPVRGQWKNNDWKGWWGEEPPYHCPVFILTHHERKQLEMKGGTTFYFITDGIESAFEKAKNVSEGKDIRIGGGVSTIRQFLQAGYIDEIHLAISPVLLGEGEHLFSGINMHQLGFNKIQRIEGEGTSHFILAKDV